MKRSSLVSIIGNSGKQLGVVVSHVVTPETRVGPRRGGRIPYGDGRLPIHGST